jgi:hypothetical protein
MGLAEWFARLFGGKPEQPRIHEDLLQMLEGHMPLLQTLHARRSLAPLAASMDLSGEVTGSALTVEAGHETPSVDFALNYFAEQFRTQFRDRRIRAAAIFFHGHYQSGSVRPARTAEEANTLVAWLEHASGQSVEAVIAYRFVRHPSVPGVGEWEYDPPAISEKPSATTSGRAEPAAAPDPAS